MLLGSTAPASLWCHHFCHILPFVSHSSPFRPASPASISPHLFALPRFAFHGSCSPHLSSLLLPPFALNLWNPTIALSIQWRGPTTQTSCPTAHGPAHKTQVRRNSVLREVYQATNPFLVRGAYLHPATKDPCDSVAGVRFVLIPGTSKCAFILLLPEKAYIDIYLPSGLQSAFSSEAFLFKWQPLLGCQQSPFGRAKSLLVGQCCLFTAPRLSHISQNIQKALFLQEAEKNEPPLLAGFDHESQVVSHHFHQRHQRDHFASFSARFPQLPSLAGYQREPTLSRLC